MVFLATHGPGFSPGTWNSVGRRVDNRRRVSVRRTVDDGRILAAHHWRGCVFHGRRRCSHVDDGLLIIAAAFSSICARQPPGRRGSSSVDLGHDPSRISAACCAFSAWPSCWPSPSASSHPSSYSFSVFIGLFVGFAMTGGNLNINRRHPCRRLGHRIRHGRASFLVLAVLCDVLSAGMYVFVEMMIVRALGYWTRQFDVPAAPARTTPCRSAGGSGGLPHLLSNRRMPPAGQPPHAGLNPLSLLCDFGPSKRCASTAHGR